MSAVFIPYREVFMNYAGIKEYDIANGPGIRFSLFVSGCTHHCRGCFNPDTWSFHYGKPFTKETEDYIIRQLGQDCYQGMTLLGGEPMEPVNQKGLLPLVKRFKETYPEKISGASPAIFSIRKYSVISQRLCLKQWSF